MKRTVLLFPDTTSILEFLLSCAVGNAEVSSKEKTLVALLTDHQITIACTRYKAVLKTMVGV